MRIFVFEYVIGGGLHDGGPAAVNAIGLLTEAVAITAAVAADFAALPGVNVIGLRDAELCELPPPVDDFRGIQGPCFHAEQFVRACVEADGTLLIAPETGGILTAIAQRVESVGAKMFSPSSSFCEWASDKTCVATTMHTAGVPMPRGILLQSDDAVPDDFPRPVVLKPNDGCGSMGITLLASGTASTCLLPPGEGGRRPDEGTLLDVGLDAVQAVHEVESPTNRLIPSPDRCRDRPLPAGEAKRRRLEQYVPGLAVSVALLRGPAGVFPLPACRQRLSDDGAFTYLGGSCPLSPEFAKRAERLALLAAAAMPEWRGYIGLDLVLGPAEDGSQDYLIEVNPRLTTSYVGLRALSETNLAQAMLDVVAGRVPKLAFRIRGVEFDADGMVRYV